MHGLLQAAMAAAEPDAKRAKTGWSPSSWHGRSTANQMAEWEDMMRPLCSTTHINVFLWGNW